jgi:hypothetical protein
LSKPEPRLPLLASWDGQVPAALIASMVEFSILSGQGWGCARLFESLLPEHEENARQHALRMLLRLEPGNRRRILLDALLRRWPLAVLGVIPELATDEEKAHVIRELLLQETFRETHLPASRLDLLRWARDLKEPAWRGKALRSLLRVMPEEYTPQLTLEVLSAAFQSSDEGFILEVIRQAEDKASGKALEQGLEELRLTQAPSQRALLSRVLLSLGPPELRDELMRELLAATRQLRPEERTAALGTATRHLSQALVPEVLELLKDAPQGESWFRVHEGLVPYLTTQQLGQLLTEAEGAPPGVLQAVCHPELERVTQELGYSLDHMEPGCPRAMVLLALIDRHPGAHREWLVDRTLTVLDGVWTRDVKARVLAGLVRRLGAFSPRMERMATGLWEEQATNLELIAALGPVLTPSMMQSLLESLAKALPSVRASTFSTLARTLSEERRWELVQLLQGTPPLVRVWGLAALEPGLVGSNAELLRLALADIQQAQTEGEVRQLFSVLSRAVPDKWLPRFFEFGWQRGLAGQLWFVELAVASVRRAPELIEPAIHAASVFKEPWTHFAELAMRISELPHDERLRNLRILLGAAGRAKKPVSRDFVELIKRVVEIADPAHQGHDIAKAVAALKRRSEESPYVAAFLNGTRPTVVIGDGSGEDPFELLGHDTRHDAELRTDVLSMRAAEAYFPVLPVPRAPSIFGGEQSPEARALRALDALERSLPRAEPVLLGTSAPVKVSTGDEFTARFVACVERRERELEEKLERLGPGANTVIGFQRCQWQLGSRFRVRVTSPHLVVSPEEQEFVWNADSSVLDFGVRVPPKARGRRTSLQFEVFLDGARVALLRHDLSVALLKGKAGKRSARLSRAPRTAFASFASKDRNRVLDRIASLRLAAGLDVFMDCLSLRPGEEWKKSLLTEIRKRELFLLFWSRHAQASQWVEWEWRTALKVKKREAIQPHPLDPVDEAPPPKELSMLHFGDVYMLVRSKE